MLTAKQIREIKAEAGTVFHESGLTPRELLIQRNEFLNALRLIHKLMFEDVSHPLSVDQEHIKLLLTSAITKSETK